MKIERFYILFFSIICLFLSSQSLSFSADLIEPSRTLEGKKQNVGKLSVFSDPPGLDVFLDGVDIGKTPIFLKEVTTGGGGFLEAIFLGWALVRILFMDNYVR